MNNIEGLHVSTRLICNLNYNLIAVKNSKSKEKKKERNFQWNLDEECGKARRSFFKSEVTRKFLKTFLVKCFARGRIEAIKNNFSP